MIFLVKILWRKTEEEIEKKEEINEEDVKIYLSEAG